MPIVGKHSVPCVSTLDNTMAGNHWDFTAVRHKTVLELDNKNTNVSKANCLFSIRVFLGVEFVCCYFIGLSRILING